jgi:hypothetical protein
MGVLEGNRYELVVNAMHMLCICYVVVAVMYGKMPRQDDVWKSLQVRLPLLACDTMTRSHDTSSDISESVGTMLHGREEKNTDLCEMFSLDEH